MLHPQVYDVMATQSSWKFVRLLKQSSWSWQKTLPRAARCIHRLSMHAILCAAFTRKCLFLQCLLDQWQGRVYIVHNNRELMNMYEQGFYTANPWNELTCISPGISSKRMCSLSTRFKLKKKKKQRSWAFIIYRAWDRPIKWK